MTVEVLAAAALAAAAVVTGVTGASCRGLPVPAPDLRRLTWPVGLSERYPRLGPALWVVVVPVVLFGPAVLAAGALALALARSVHRMRAVRIRRSAASATAAVVADAVTALAADLSAGHAPLASLAALGMDTSTDDALSDRLRWVAATGHLGGDVPGALRVAAARPGASALSDVAAAWQVAEETGAPLAQVLDQAAHGIARRQAAQRRLEVSLAGARASARLLVALPLLGIVIGSGLGVSPLSFLLGPLVGRACLVSGLVLSAVGVAWTDGLAARALLAGGRPR